MTAPIHQEDDALLELYRASRAGIGLTEFIRHAVAYRHAIGQSYTPLFSGLSALSTLLQEQAAATDGGAADAYRDAAQRVENLLNGFSLLAD